jgi:hypothetical protein
MNFLVRFQVLTVAYMALLDIVSSCLAEVDRRFIALIMEAERIFEKSVSGYKAIYLRRV